MIEVQQPKNSKELWEWIENLKDSEDSRTQRNKRTVNGEEKYVAMTTAKDFVERYSTKVDTSKLH